MSRRDDMTDDGKLPCGLCKQWLHITEFYTQPVREDTPSKQIWWGDPITGKQYGRPKSYCKGCNRVTARGPVQFETYARMVRRTNDTRVWDPNRAWTKAHQENAIRTWNAEHPPEEHIPMPSM